MKDRIGIIAFAAILWTFALPASGHAASAANALASYDWSVNATPNLASKPPPTAVVADFVADGAWVNVPQYLKGAGAKGLYQLCSFTFADLRHGGTLSLVASVDATRRMFCNQILVVDRNPLTLQTWEINVLRGAAITGVGRLLKNLGGNGKVEIVAPTGLSGYYGASHCMASWPVVYGWTGTGYANVSDNFAGFYQGRLNALTAQIAALPARSEEPLAPSDPGYARDCLEAEAAKIQRFLGISPDAGLTQAAALTTSTNRDEREFGLNLLADIGTSDTLSYVKALTSDKEHRIAEAARRQLAMPQGNRPPQPARTQAVAITVSGSAR